MTGLDVGQERLVRGADRRIHHVGRRRSGFDGDRAAAEVVDARRAAHPRTTEFADVIGPTPGRSRGNAARRARGPVRPVGAADLAEGSVGTEDPVLAEGPVRSEERSGRVGRPRPSGRPPAAASGSSTSASITTRISQALVEMPSAVARSSTLDLTDWGSRSVTRATGSSSISASGSSPVGRSPGPHRGGAASVRWSVPCTMTANSGSWPDIRSSTDDGASSALMVAAASDSAWMRASRVEDSIAAPSRSATCWVCSSASDEAFATPVRTDSTYGERSMTSL